MRARHPSIFSTEGDPVGIQVCTAIATLVRKAEHMPAEAVEFRHLWGQTKPADLIETAEAEPEALYGTVEPIPPLGLPFVRTAVSADWFDWPALTELYPVSYIACIDLMDRSATCIPAWLHDDGIGNDVASARRSNLTATAQRYVDRLGLGVEDLFHPALATLHDPAYREANAGALRMGWPRIPLPGWPDGRGGDAADELARSAARGRELAALLDPDTPVPDVTRAPLRPEIAAIAVPATVGGRNMAGGDFAVTAGWGHFGQGDAVMSGQGRASERAYSADERGATGGALAALGEKTLDIWLNGEAFWRKVPATVWNYRLGGYQVLKKWDLYT